MERFAFFLFLLPACFAQTYLPHDLTAGFRYKVKLGQNTYNLGNVPGYALKYSCRAVRWLAIEAGLEQIPRPVGAGVCCEYLTNANDELFVVPFGVRYVWEPEGRRLRLSLDGGGAYLNHTFGHEALAYGLVNASAWGGQAVAGGDYALTRSGHFRAGLTARYYYIPVTRYTTARILIIGPDFTFSFR